MTHVFIVNEQTIKVHLEHLFAGTGSSNEAPFLIDANYRNPQKKEYGVTSSSERNLAAMIADISRIRVGDKIIFYLQAHNDKPGMFFGIFEVASEAFYQPNSDGYLTNELGKTLNFRVLIKGNKVFPKGVSEHCILDSLSAIQHPSDMCWSLIYRKLKGNRGCTMITDKESERIEFILSEINHNSCLQSNLFSFKNNEIIQNNIFFEYTGSKLSLDILPRLIYKTKKNNKCESHLQAYIVQNIDNEPLKSLILKDLDNLWIGNEVSCGVGMQRIDLSTIQIDENYVYINIIELKCTEAYNGIIDNQIPWYIDWIRYYIVPTFLDKKVIITPVVLAKKFDNEIDQLEFQNHCSTLYCYNNKSFQVKPISLITYTIENENIHFTKEF